MNQILVSVTQVRYEERKPAKLVNYVPQFTRTVIRYQKVIGFPFQKGPNSNFLLCGSKKTTNRGEQLGSRKSAVYLSFSLPVGIGMVIQ